jgi:hypothetical protein
MWNLEQTELLVLRLMPVFFVAMALALALMTTALQPARLSPAFAPAAESIARPR